MSKISLYQLSYLSEQELDSGEINRRIVLARCANKNTIKVILHLPIKIDELKNTISKRFRFKNDNFLLFCEGKEITL